MTKMTHQSQPLIPDFSNFGKHIQASVNEGSKITPTLPFLFKTIKEVVNIELQLTIKHLLKMCTEKIIPTELHHWYQNLPDKEGRDLIPEEEYSDAEDEYLL